MNFAQLERQRLGDLFLELGPEEPTLNDGWLTHDLATHLFIRERRPWVAPGMFLKPLEPLLEWETKRQKERPYVDVVRAWAGGPPLPLYPLNAAMNTAEHFIHHEDVRRGGGEIRPRSFSKEVNAQLFAWAKRFGALAFRSSDVPVILTPPEMPPATLGGKAGVAARGDDVIRVSGEPGELLIWVSGRDAAKVDISGNTQAAEELDRGV